MSDKTTRGGTSDMKNVRFFTAPSENVCKT